MRFGALLTRDKHHRESFGLISARIRLRGFFQLRTRAARAAACADRREADRKARMIEPDVVEPDTV